MFVHTCFFLFIYIYIPFNFNACYSACCFNVKEGIEWRWSCLMYKIHSRS
ncbi:hypothetical protein GLYMA_12G098550v4 [Glycine max]|nr:hypothetical protein GLYMA_12G098550v4 [Glycine max]KAH1142462.1 hypothetical protein GYH30_033245 [Glycine max]